MELGIYSKDGRLKLSVAPGDNGACSCGIQEESILAVSFTAFECIALEVYDYADFEGRRYWILERYLPQMNAGGNGPILSVCPELKDWQVKP